MIIFLSIIATIGIVSVGIENTLPNVLISVVTASLLDSIVKYFRSKQFKFQKSGTITGLFIGMLIPTTSPYYIPALAAVLAILIKNIVKIDGKHIFNPTASALFIVGVLFSSVASWWATFSTGYIIYVIIIFGLFIAYTFKRFGLVTSYLGTFFLILLLLDIFQSIDRQGPGFVVTNLVLITDPTLLFFVFFILVEPKTSPFFKKGRIIYGASSAVISFIVLTFFPQQNLILALLLSNLLVPLINWKIKS